MSSYLADVKKEICDLADKLTADIEEDLGEIEGLDDLFTSYKNSLWKIVEKQLKQSFQNQVGDCASKGVVDVASRLPFIPNTLCVSIRRHAIEEGHHSVMALFIEIVGTQIGRRDQCSAHAAGHQETSAKQTSAAPHGP